jgi:archaellum component FlaC
MLLIAMVEDPDNLVLRYLQAIDARVDGLAQDMHEVKTRLSILEQQIGVGQQQYASISSRLDRIETRLERIERRLELVDTPT